MHDCLILGAGRSGTSMLGGILADAGYFLGDRLYPPRGSNPRGFFEDAGINAINEDILSAYDATPTVYSRGRIRRWVRGAFGRHGRNNPGSNQRWLVALPLETRVECSRADVEERIREAVSRRPFAYKDPRFAFTYAVWAPALPEQTRLVGIIRDPSVTVQSVLQECASMRYLRRLDIDPRIAFEVLRLHYLRLLRLAEEAAHAVQFVHYEQILGETGVASLANFLDAPLRDSFADPSLRRSTAEVRAPAAVLRVYAELCERASYRPSS